MLSNRKPLTIVVVFITLLLMIASFRPAYANSPGYHYAGQTSGSARFTGIWGYIKTVNVTLANTANNHTVHWIGKTRIVNSSPTESTQVGWGVGVIGSLSFGNTEHFYIEYTDYTGAYLPIDKGVASGNNQFAVWSNNSQGTDSLGRTYVRTYVNLKSGPDRVSPTLVVRLGTNDTRVDAIGEVYNDTSTNEPMGTVVYGDLPAGGSFFDIGRYLGSGNVSWSAWTASINTPSIFQTAPYRISVRTDNYQEWIVTGP